MKDRIAYQAASASQQTVEAGASLPVPSSVETPRNRVKTAAAPGLTFPRFFTEAGVDPFDEVEWELRAAVIGNERGEVVFEQRDVEIPKAWSQQATNIVVSKYFRGQIGTPERERSVRQLIGRVVDTITGWARAAEVLRERRGSAGVQRRSEAHPRLPEGGVQQPGVVQLRLREGAAVLGLLHQLGAGHDGLDPDAGADRGHAVQVRLRHRHATCRRSARRRSCWPAAARRRARCRS